MLERNVSYDSHRPIPGKGVTLFSEPNVTRYATMTAEDMTRTVRDIPMPFGEKGDIIVPVPTVETHSTLPLSDIIYEVRDDVIYFRTSYGDIPVGGIEQRSFKTLTGKNAHMHLTVPAYVGPDDQEIFRKRIFSVERKKRAAEAQRVIKMLPKVSFHQDKGLMFQIAGNPILTLTPNGPLINREFKDDGAKLSYNFCELEQNQELLSYEGGFYLEYAVHQTDNPFIDSNNDSKTLYMIAGVSFPQLVDFNFINTYIKTYLENGGKLTDDLVRDELVNPYFEIFLKDPEEEDE